MLLDLGKIRTPHVAFDETYPPEQFPGGEDQYRIVEPVRMHLDIAKTGERFRLTGHVQTVLGPLCGDECRGLCPVCGTNLNRGSCDCNREWEDPRMAALRAFRNQS